MNIFDTELPKGTKGDAGPKGPIGLIGPKGDKGDRGIQGPKGDTGSTGTAGSRGDIGPKGTQGDTGNQGVQGLTGPKGDKGDKGDQGIPGTSISGVDVQELPDGQEILQIKLDNGLLYSVGNIKGSDGIDGQNGLAGTRGLRGHPGRGAIPDGGTTGQVLTKTSSANGAANWQTPSGGGGGSGTVTSVSVTTANGISGSVATATTTPAITLTLGAITPTTINGVTLSGSSTPTLAVTGTTTVSGSNTGDQTSVSGNSGSTTTTAITDDTTTNTDVYPTWVTTTTGNLAQKVSSTKLSFNPSTGLLASTGFSGALTGNVTGNTSGSSGSCTGNAATATALATPRAINGTNFDGTAAITVTAAAGTLTGATLNSTVTASSLTSVGTLAALTLGGTLAMGVNDITSTGSLGATGSRLTKGWFTDLQVTNAIAGSVTGNAATATALQNARTIGGVSFDGTAAIVPQTIQSINEATDTTCFPLFISASGSQSLQPLNNAGFTYNSNTNNLTCTTFTGALSGNASTVTTNANLTGPITSSGNATSIASQTGTGTKFVVDNTPTLITPILGTASATTMTLSGASQTELDVAANTGSSYTIDQANGHSFRLTLNAATPTLTLQTAPASGKAVELVVQLIQDATGGRAPTWANVTWAAGAAPAIAQAVGAVTYLSFSGTNGGWIGYASAVTTGVTDASNAGAGYIGEVLRGNVATGSAVTLTTATYADVTSIALTAGDWEVMGAIGFNGTITGTLFLGFYGTATGNSNTGLDLSETAVQNTLAPTAVTDIVDALPVFRVNISATTTYYLKAYAVFTVGTCKAYGTIRARRIR